VFRDDEFKGKANVVKESRTGSVLETVSWPMYGVLRRTMRRLFWAVLSRTAKGKKIRVRLASGDAFVVRVGDQISRFVYEQGCHEPELASKLMPFIKPGMTVFDVGANIGCYTVLMARLVGPSGSVHAFEINENVIDLLEENIRVSGVNNVTIVRKAVARTSGEAEFLVPGTGDEGEGSLRKSDRYVAASVIKVPTISLDDYVYESGIKSVDVIKIDVEGGEYEAFEGANTLLGRRVKPVIMFEALDTACNSFGITWLDVLENLRSRGYRIHQGDTCNFFATPLE